MAESFSLHPVVGVGLKPAPTKPAPKPVATFQNPVIAQNIMFLNFHAAMMLSRLRKSAVKIN